MSDHDSWTDPQSGAPVKKRMSGCLLASLIVGGLGLVVGLICCGGAFWFGSKFIPVQAKSPAEVIEVGKRILNVEMIDGFGPDTAETWDNPFYVLRFAEFKHNEGKGRLLMSLASGKTGDPNMLKAQTGPVRELHSKKLTDSILIKKSESKQIVVNGQNVSVSIGEGTDRGGVKAFHSATLEFDQSATSYYFIIVVDDDIWDEAAVLKMFEDAKPQ